MWERGARYRAPSGDVVFRQLGKHPRPNPITTEHEPCRNVRLRKNDQDCGGQYIIRRDNKPRDEGPCGQLRSIGHDVVISARIWRRRLSCRQHRSQKQASDYG